MNHLQIEGLRFTWKNLCDNYMEGCKDKEEPGGVILAHTMVGGALSTI